MKEQRRSSTTSSERRAEISACWALPSAVAECHSPLGRLCMDACRMCVVCWLTCTVCTPGCRAV